MDVAIEKGREWSAGRMLAAEWEQDCVESFVATPDADLVFGVHYR